MGSQTPSSTNQKLSERSQVSCEVSQDHPEKTNEDCLAGFAHDLQRMETVILSAISDNTLVSGFGDNVLRPDIKSIAFDINKFREERSVKIINREQTLSTISDLLFQALIRINSAAQMEKDSDREHDKRYWDDLQNCYLDCANLLLKARQQIGEPKPEEAKIEQPKNMQNPEGDV